MTDDIIIEALKHAIVHAFFVQQQYYPVGQNYPVQYGGISAQLVDAIMKHESFKVLIQEMAGEASSRVEEIKKLVSNSIKERVEKTMEEYVGNYYFNDWVRDEIKKVAIPVIEKTVAENKSFIDRVQKQVNTDNYELEITVVATAEKKI